MLIRSVFAVAAAIAVIGAAELRAEPLSLAPVDHLRTPFDRFLRDPQIEEGTGESAVLPPELRRQVVSYPSREAPGTIIIDTPNIYLYYVLGGGRALRYGIGVGREGFTWSGTESVSRTAEWPDWSPPPEIANPICRASWRAVRAIRWARGRFISAIPPIASTAPMTRPPSATGCRADASG